MDDREGVAGIRRPKCIARYGVRPSKHFSASLAQTQTSQASSKMLTSVAITATLASYGLAAALGAKDYSSLAKRAQPVYPAAPDGMFYLSIGTASTRRRPLYLHETYAF